MNRVDLSLDHTIQSSSYVLEGGRFHTDFDAGYSLFSPLHYEAKYAYPLVVWLHNNGSSEQQLQRIMPQLSMRNYVAVAPRGRNLRLKRNSQEVGWEQTPWAIERAADRIYKSIEVAKQRFHVADQRVFIGGFAEGGTMAYRIGLQSPRNFAGVFAFCGNFPLDYMPLRQVNEARKLPLFLAHGRQSSTMTVDRSCQELRLLHTAGFDLEFRQYPCADLVDPQMLVDLNRWIMQTVSSSCG